MITVLKEQLYEILSIASHFTLSKISSVPTLQNGLLTITKNKLEIITTNLNEFFYSQIKVSSPVEKKAIVDVKKITEFLSFIQPGKIELSLEEGGLMIRTNKTKAMFATVMVGDFPKLPDCNGKKYTLTNDILKNTLPSIVFSAAMEEARPVLSGVNFCVIDNKRFIVATDGFRLSLYSYESDDKQFPQCIVSARVLGEVIRLSEGGKGVEVEFSESEKVVKFSFGEMVLYSRIIDGDFPPFQRVIPTSHSSRLTINRNEFIRNIKLASVFARELSNIIVFNLKRDGIYMSPKNKDLKDTVIYQSGELEGDEQSTAFNFKYVLDFLNNIKSEEVIFEMTGKNSPSVFKSKDMKNYLHVIMPVRTDEE